MGAIKLLRKIFANERGWSLLEVLAALYIIALIVMGVLSTSGTSALWIRGARDQTLASVYAASIVDILRSNSLQLYEQLQLADPWIIVDENPADAVFTWTLWDETIALEAPTDVNTTITATCFEEGAYYDGIALGGIYQIGIGDEAEEITFYGNLMVVKVEMEWGKGSGHYMLSTIIGGR